MHTPDTRAENSGGKARFGVRTRHKRKFVPGVGMMIRFSLLEKKMGIMRFLDFFVFLRVELVFSSLLSTLGISAAILLS
jgi:hypothetical protein